MSDGIVPPWMSKDWQLLRSHLRLAAAHATAAAEASTLEVVAEQGGLAQTALMDADFVRRRIIRSQREEVLPDVDDRGSDEP